MPERDWSDGRRAAMGNLSCSVSGLGAGDASRKSVRGSARTCRRQRASSSCCHFNDIIGVLDDRRLSKVTRQERGQVAKNDVARVVSTVALEELLDFPGRPENQNVDLDESSYCVSPYSEAGSCDSGGECSRHHDDYHLEQLVTSLRDNPDDDEDDNVDNDNDDDDDHVLVVCEEDKAMMFLKSPSTICGEEWINWTTLCPCCRRDASDDSIDLQEMIKLEPIRVGTASPPVVNYPSLFSNKKHVCCRRRSK